MQAALPSPDCVRIPNSMKAERGKEAAEEKLAEIGSRGVRKAVQGEEATADVEALASCPEDLANIINEVAPINNIFSM